MPVITFSQKFQDKHPRKGEPTYFVEQILNEIGRNYQEEFYLELLATWNLEKIKKGEIKEVAILDFSEKVKSGNITEEEVNAFLKFIYPTADRKEKNELLGKRILNKEISPEEFEKFINLLLSRILKYHHLETFFSNLNPEIEANKLHTIRGGYHFAAGKNFTPVVWSSKPYNSPQIIFYDDIEVVKTYEFMSEKSHGEYFYNITSKDGNQVHSKGLIEGDDMFSQIAQNDGLSTPDFAEWFEGDGLDFSGQIICWTDPKYLQV